jgi:hypothetical protein
MLSLSFKTLKEGISAFILKIRKQKLRDDSSRPFVKIHSGF